MQLLRQAETARNSAPVPTSTPVVQNWETNSTRAVIADHLQAMRNDPQWRVSDDAPSTLRPFDAAGHGELRFRPFLGQGEPTLPTSQFTGSASSGDGGVVSAHLDHMRRDVYWNPKNPTYDMQRPGATAFSQDAISSHATDKKLLTKYLRNIAQSIGEGAQRYAPDVKGSAANVMARLGTQPRAVARAADATKLFETVNVRNLAPIGKNATFSVDSAPKMDRSGLLAVSRHALPTDPQMNRQMLREMQQAPSVDLASFAARLTRAEFDVSFAGVKAAGSKGQQLADVCYNDETVVAEVARHLNPQSVNDAVIAHLGNGQHFLGIDGTRVELKRALPNCSYVVQRAMIDVNGRQELGIHIAVKARWDINTIAGETQSRRLADGMGTFTAVVDIPIAFTPSDDENNEQVGISYGNVNVSAETSVSNLIKFTEQGVIQ